MRSKFFVAVLVATVSLNVFAAAREVRIGLETIAWGLAEQGVRTVEAQMAAREKINGERLEKIQRSTDK